MFHNKPNFLLICIVNYCSYQNVDIFILYLPILYFKMLALDLLVATIKLLIKLKTNLYFND